METNNMNDNQVFDVEVLNKGLHREGVFATRSFNRGELIFAEPVVVSYELTKKDMNSPGTDALFLVRHILENKDARSEFKSLELKAIPGVFEKPKKSENHALRKLSKSLPYSHEQIIRCWQIVSTYFIIARHTNDVKNSAATKEYSFIRCQLSHFHSKINHSCSPNARPTAVFKSKESYFDKSAPLFASKKISAGEEITFSYMMQPEFSYLPVLTRQKVLQQNYHFKCVCKKCLAE